jgi:hypothetical protein
VRTEREGENETLIDGIYTLESDIGSRWAEKARNWPGLLMEAGLISCSPPEMDLRRWLL